MAKSVDATQLSINQIWPQDRHNDIHHNETQHNDTQDKNTHNDTQDNDTEDKNTTFQHSAQQHLKWPSAQQHPVERHLISLENNKFPKSVKM